MVRFLSLFWGEIVLNKRSATLHHRGFRAIAFKACLPRRQASDEKGRFIYVQVSAPGLFEDEFVRGHVPPAMSGRGDKYLPGFHRMGIVLESVALARKILYSVSVTITCVYQTLYENSLVPETFTKFKEKK